MRHLLFCLACLPAVSMAQQLPDNFNQEQFEKRFRAADKDGDGRLSREEAYAAFPRAPEFFKEIDANNDNHVTLIEFNQAMNRRAEAALKATTLAPGAKYVKPGHLKDDQTPAGGESDTTDLSAAIAQKRSNDFYEFLEGRRDGSSTPSDRDLPDPVASPSNLFNKSF
jgi:hypothetical protein